MPATCLSAVTPSTRPGEGAADMEKQPSLARHASEWLQSTLPRPPSKSSHQYQALTPLIIVLLGGPMSTCPSRKHTRSPLPGPFPSPLLLLLFLHAASAVPLSDVRGVVVCAWHLALPTPLYPSKSLLFTPTKTFHPCWVRDPPPPPYPLGTDPGVDYHGVVFSLGPTPKYPAPSSRIRDSWQVLLRILCGLSHSPDFPIRETPWS